LKLITIWHRAMVITQSLIYHSCTKTQVLRIRVELHIATFTELELPGYQYNII